MGRAKLSEIIECLEAHKELSLDDICEKVGHSSKTMRLAIKSLINSGFVEMVPPPPAAVWNHEDLSASVKYKLTPLGRI